MYQDICLHRIEVSLFEVNSYTYRSQFPTNENKIKIVKADGGRHKTHKKLHSNNLNEPSHIGISGYLGKRRLRSLLLRPRSYVVLLSYVAALSLIYLSVRHHHYNCSGDGIGVRDRHAAVPKAEDETEDATAEQQALIFLSFRNKW